MIKTIELKGIEISLILRVVNESNWCNVYLVNNKEVKLGAECIENISKRIISYLRSGGMDQTSISKYKGRDVVSIIGLFEEHTWIYGTQSLNGNHLKIYCIEDGGKELAEIHLTKSIVNDWIFHLENFQF